MDKNKLKGYAPKARAEFIKAVTERAALYGITSKRIEPCEIKGDFALVSGKPFPKSIEQSRNELIKRIESKDFSQVMEEAAYIWFNRFAAIRFMEVNGYLTHGYRVLSHPEGHAEPEILEKAQYLEGLDGLDKEEILALKTEGNKDAELYRKLIIAQCNELHNAMPFLFEKVDDPTELLLPDNLLNTDSVIRQMISAISEEDWKEVEIIGWLYQFYILEKKDALMKAKKAYKTEDIPAVTQLFTPNWIVKYLVENSLGAKWLQTYPTSSIKGKMEYYIEPTEQADEVKQKIKEITPDVLNPEELTVMDPACGSGHILVEAYNLLKEIYLERGYRPKDIPEHILTKNLYGLEIDDRAAQLAGFALMMKARKDDRQIFGKDIKPNILVIRSAESCDQNEQESDDIKQLIDLFENASTFGSLIRVPKELIIKLPDTKRELEHKRKDLSSHDVFTGTQYYEDLLVLVRQAEVLSQRYDCVVANPPYMGSKGMNVMLKEFAGTQYPIAKSDLFAMFIERGFELAKDRVGFNAMVTMQSWMFRASYVQFRECVLQNRSIFSMAHLGARAFSEISGEIVSVTAFTMLNQFLKGYKPTFLRLVDLVEDKKAQAIAIRENRYSNLTQGDFLKINSYPIVYWISQTVLNCFLNMPLLSKAVDVREGMATGCNDLFLRLWHEVDLTNIFFKATSEEEAKKTGRTWFPYLKGGGVRKWAGYYEYVVNWAKDGKAIRSFADESTGRIRSHNYNGEYAFKPGITWSSVSSGTFAVRNVPSGFMFDATGTMGFLKNKREVQFVGSFLNSVVANHFIRILATTMHIKLDNVLSIPFCETTISEHEVVSCYCKSLEISLNDWNSFETSRDFKMFPMLSDMLKGKSLEESFGYWEKLCSDNTRTMKQLEEENNRLFIKAYGLQDELISDVFEEDITLARANKEVDTKCLISYSIGCMMGRYSLDKPGLIYAHSGNEGFDATQYKTFPADDDGIVPITDHEWFDDDVACRFFKFVEIAWDKKGLDSNIDFIADAIGRKSGESSRETIRRYFVNDFYKDHCKTYKKRPIYWLFTSGKEKAFQALVYLHRYNEGTLARMRTEYVLPLQTKINRHIEHLEKDKDSASLTSVANKIQKEIASLLKQKDELIKFDERLRHYADMKIKLDLDDGVIVNYVKFDDLLAKI